MRRSNRSPIASSLLGPLEIVTAVETNPLWGTFAKVSVVSTHLASFANAVSEENSGWISKSLRNRGQQCYFPPAEVSRLVTKWTSDAGDPEKRPGFPLSPASSQERDQYNRNDPMERTGSHLQIHTPTIRDFG